MNPRYNDSVISRRAFFGMGLAAAALPALLSAPRRRSGEASADFDRAWALLLEADAISGGEPYVRKAAPRCGARYLALCRASADAFERAYRASGDPEARRMWRGLDRELRELGA